MNCLLVGRKNRGKGYSLILIFDSCNLFGVGSVSYHRMGQLTDQHYIDRTLAGEVVAFSVLIDRYKHMIFTLALKILKNREEAEEVAQDAFLKAYTSLSTFRGEAAFSSWLYKIAYYRALDRLKSLKRRRAEITCDMQEVRKLTAEVVESGSPEDLRKAAMARALQDLSAEDSVLLTLFYYEELSLKEIAGIMGITPNSAKVRLFRSRERLARCLKNSNEPEKIYSYGLRK